MNTAKLKTFAQNARRNLMEQVAARLENALHMEGAAQAENAKAIRELQAAIFKTSKAEVVERVAYTWFNRFCALRFMDANDYTLVRAVSPAEGASQPEVLAEAKQGTIRDELALIVNQKRVNDLLTGNLPSPDGQGEAYRLLLVAVCNYYHRVMPYLFEKIDDYTELLMPADLLSDHSILSAVRTALDADACQDVEVIGWLYQFYISEKKDAVFKAKKAVSAEDIPAATQLFTPNWIVRYLVENSLGRLWLLNHPQSRLKARMAYYVEPEQPEADFLRIQSPEALRICDPACGSGHMLVYAFELLYAIYEEQGYTTSEIPALILTHNLYGVEIDERAGALAAFALTMKARQKQRRFFRQPVQPNICVLENIDFAPDELGQYVDAVGSDLFTFKLETLLRQFAQAKTFGSLIRPVVSDVSDLRQTLAERDMGGQLFLHGTHQKVLKALAQADILSPKYHVVVANPPYMGSGGMNSNLKAFANSEYRDSKTDLFSMFIERNLELAVKHGCVAMVTMHSWMFLSSFENLRQKLLNRETILSMAHFGIGAFDTLNSKVVQTTAFVLEHGHREKLKGAFLQLTQGYKEELKQQAFPAALSAPYRAAAADFKKIPGSPIAYWVSGFELFSKGVLKDIMFSGGRLKTHDGNRYIRYLWEVNRRSQKWRRIIKGGQFRKYFGNEESIVDWSQDALDFYASQGGLPPSEFSYRQGVSWTKVTSAIQSFRIKYEYAEYDSASPVVFIVGDKTDLFAVLAYLNSPIQKYFLAAFNPTMNTQVSDVLSLPLVPDALDEDLVAHNTRLLVKLAHLDWDAYETSWDFTSLSLLAPEHCADTLAASYDAVRGHWQCMTQEMQQLEQENNHIFIDAYGLQDELTPDLPLEEITLTCNPRYRYGGNRSDAELETLLRADTMREFISYAVGCMFGRYALEAPGLVLANQGETLDDYLRCVPNSSFPADRDNVLPILDGDWFTDDIVERFHRFLRLTFGDEHFEENRAFIENAIGRDIRSYFLRDFYDDHVRRYKKRPIYWLFSSPGGSFNALIYMHRYRPDTVSVVLNDYLREYRKKLEARIGFQEAQSISASLSPRDRTAALKELDRLRKVVRELNDYEREVLFPLAAQQVKIDLDDGVKVNYAKFGKALKPIAGLNDED